ncbi:hypothetical protein ZWY2020_058696 [Hordeum vulgare]|nr:hypothetical protein ZWY2020_058696 [Hordeum vulgare]
MRSTDRDASRPAVLRAGLQLPPPPKKSDRATEILVGRRWPRGPRPVAEKPATAVDDDSGRSEGVASPDTPLGFPEDDEHDEATEAAATEDAAAKAYAQDKVSRPTNKTKAHA